MFYVILTILYLRVRTIETSSSPTDSSRPLFKQIEIFSRLRAVSLFSCPVEQNVRDTQMTTTKLLKLLMVEFTRCLGYFTSQTNAIDWRLHSRVWSTPNTSLTLTSKVSLTQRFVTGSNHYHQLKRRMTGFEWFYHRTKSQQKLADIVAAPKSKHHHPACVC